jgi:hypothetical protein
MAGPMLARHVGPGQLHAPWTHILDGANELTVGIHYGSTDRIDFAVNETTSHIPSSLVGLAAAPRLISAELPTKTQPRIRNLSVEQGCVHGSFLVRSEQFQRWLASIYAQRSSRSIPYTGR